MKINTSYVLGCGLMLMAGAGVAVAMHAAGIVVNTTPSLPLGFYQLDKSGKSDLAMFCPEPGRVASVESLQRGYRQKGRCPDGGEPFLKPVVAKEGDTVEVGEEGVQVNGGLLSGTKPLAVDSEGRPMRRRRWGKGPEAVGKGELWVVSDYNANSYDSRYFGPIPEAWVIGRMREVWVLR